MCQWLRSHRRRPDEIHILGGLDYVKIMLDDHYRVAVVTQTVQDQQLGNVVEMQARLVKNIRCRAWIARGELYRWASPPESVVDLLVEALCVYVNLHVHERL